MLGVPQVEARRQPSLGELNDPPLGVRMDRAFFYAGARALLVTRNIIMDIWNSPRFKALRKAVNSSSPPPVCLSFEIEMGHLSEEDKTEIRTQV